MQKGILNDIIEATKKLFCLFLNLTVCRKENLEKKVISIELIPAHELWKKISSVPRWIEDVQVSINSVPGGGMARLLLHLITMLDPVCQFSVVEDFISNKESHGKRSHIFPIIISSPCCRPSDSNWLQCSLPICCIILFRGSCLCWQRA